MRTYLSKNVILLMGFTLALFASCSESKLSTQEISSDPSSEMDPATLLWYDEPASEWDAALPVGNGRLGAMVFGKYGEEQIQLNEDTYWSGGPYSTTVEGGAEHLAEIQRLIFDGEPIKAHKLFGRYLMGYPVEQQKYQGLANLHLFFENQDTVTQYKRKLDLTNAVTTVEYNQGDTTFTREVFASHPDSVIVVRLTSNVKDAISFEAELRGVRNSAHSNYATDYFRMDDDGAGQLIVKGKSADYLGIEGKLKFEARLKAVPEGGTMVTENARIKIENANSVTLYFAAATNFVNYKDVSADEHERVEHVMSKIDGMNYQDVKNQAVADYRQYFDRVDLKLPTSQISYLPTDERMVEIQQAADPALSTLCYNFGRYILISSSRSGTQPANLQGIWNKDMNPSWDSKYTTNINTEMNYWPVESSNLSELAEPFIKLVTELTDQGADVAREHYGAKGWVFHQNTDIWRVAAPMDGPTWGTFTVGGAWLTTQLWEHYLYNQDEEYLKEVYPVIKGSVEFFMDFLVEHPNGEWLITNPSNSPENPPKGEGYEYFYDEVTGMYYFTTIVSGSTMDTQILKDLFDYYAEASEILAVDEGFAAKVKSARSKLVPNLVGEDGTLQEWTEDFAQLEDKHRHFSHMYGLYPGNVISPNNTPELVEPVKKVLEQRGDEGTGFSMGWKMALWARLYDGDRANSIFKNYVRLQCTPSLFAKCFSSMQVDGALGVTAGITEMLMQSHEDMIDILPALPTEWSSGEYNGVKARGGFELSFGWKNSELTNIEITSQAGKTCKVRVPNGSWDVTMDGQVVEYTEIDGTYEFSTQTGATYSLVTM